MPCIHGTSDVKPLPVPFKDDEELRVWLRLPNSQQARDIVAAMSPAERAENAQLRAVVSELKAGRIPRGVIACSRFNPKTGG